MKKNLLKLTPALLPLVIGFGYAQSTSAHEQPGSLGQSGRAIDIYQVRCFDDGNGENDHIAVSVQDLLPVSAPKISVQVIRGNTATNTTDAVDGNASHSPEVIVKGSADEFYTLSVNKSGGGSENYLLEYHCISATNQHTGTELVQLNDQ
jgi:hypothetical protein